MIQPLQETGVKGMRAQNREMTRRKEVRCKVHSGGRTWRACLGLVVRKLLKGRVEEQNRWK